MSENVAHAYTEVAAKRVGTGGFVAHTFTEIGVKREGISGFVAHAYLEVMVKRPGPSEDLQYGLPLVGVLR